jgi:hypothetical protein
MSADSPVPDAAKDLDARARCLMTAVEPVLRQHLGAQRMDSSLIGELYLRVREVLARNDTQPRAGDELIDELAMTIYLVEATRAPDTEEPTALLVSLKQALDTHPERRSRTIDPESGGPES